MIDRIVSLLQDVWDALFYKAPSAVVVQNSATFETPHLIEVTSIDDVEPRYVSSSTESTEEPTMTSKIAAYFAVAKVAASAVLTAEVSAPAGATGADKLDIAKAALEAAYPELGIADVAFETVWPLVKPFIDALVAKFKSTPAASAAA